MTISNAIGIKLRYLSNPNNYLIMLQVLTKKRSHGIERVAASMKKTMAILKNTGVKRDLGI